MAKPKKPRNKRHVPRPLINPLKMAMTLAGKLTDAEREELIKPVKQCFDLLRQGKWNNAQFKHIADVFNIAQALASPGFNLLNDHIDKFDTAQEVLKAIAERRGQGKGWTCYAHELAAIATGIEFHEIQLEYASAGELARATRHVDNVLKGARSGSPGKDHIHTVLVADEVAT
jgi:hypothetical protein